MKFFSASIFRALNAHVAPPDCKRRTCRSLAVSLTGLNPETCRSFLDSTSPCRPGASRPTRHRAGFHLVNSSHPNRTHHHLGCPAREGLATHRPPLNAVRIFPHRRDEYGRPQRRRGLSASHSPGRRLRIPLLPRVQMGPRQGLPRKPSSPAHRHHRVEHPPI